MHAQIEKSKENQSKAAANSVTKKKCDGKKHFGLVDNRPVNITQRRLQMDGMDCTGEAFINTLGSDNLTPREELRIEEWEKSNLVHNFENFAKNKKKILENIRNTSTATSKAATKFGVPPLYQARNYKHSTKDPGREATLYFDDGGQTGRLRQQHGTGPLARYDDNRKKRIGVTSDDNWEDFKNEIFKKYKSISSAVDKDQKPIKVNDPPVAGDHHFECDEGSDGKSGKHPSGGTVEITNLNDNNIKDIFEGIAPY